MKMQNFERGKKQKNIKQNSLTQNEKSKQKENIQFSQYSSIHSIQSVCPID